MRLRRLAGGIAVSALAAAACVSPQARSQSDASPASPSAPSQASTAPTASAAAPSGLPGFSRVVVVVMENREYGQVIGNPDAPYVNRLARRYALFTDFHAISHPSLPNYLALLGGSTFGVTTDCTDCSANGRSLVDQLEAKGITWKAYMQGLPAPCFTGGSSGTYAKKHDPFMYFPDVASNASSCRRIVPLDALAGDLAGHRLARFVWITPDLCQDGHDCGTQVADRFLARTLPAILRQLGPTGALFLTWDEGASDAGCCAKASGGHIVTIVAGPAAMDGARSSIPTDQYSILRTIEESWRLGLLGEAGCPCTPALWPVMRPAG